ncbi:MAG: hypothetical protein E7171_06615 [Firmicutes bacterium]|nr:hypothetical protein [Bacillota bacterium]
MINLSECNKRADEIDNCVYRLQKNLSNYEEALFYVKKNDTVITTIFTDHIKTEIDKLEDIISTLKQMSKRIRETAREIYQAELKAQEEAKKSEN